MILYLLKSGFCLLVSLGFYKLVLEPEKMHRFNRVYLLVSLAFSFLAPLVSIKLGPELVPFTEALPVQYVRQGLETGLNQTVGLPTDRWEITDLFWLTYWLIATLLLVRFGRNLHVLFRQISRHATEPLGAATLVLLPENGLPYTFLNYLFVDRTAYESRAIEQELFTHELAHIRQRHSLDILLIEGLICFFWFNPLLIWFRQAIQLNHEFLADEAVTNQNPNVVHYQYLLLSKLTSTAPVFLTSTLTFQTTKQRFAMMTKQTSRAKMGLAASSAILLLLGISVAVSTQTVAQVAPATKPNQVQSKPASQRLPKLDVAEMEQRFGDKLVSIHSKKNGPKPTHKRFSDLTADEKKRVIYLAPESRKTPTEAEFEAWKNPKKYGIWVNEKRTRNFANTSLKAADIVAFSGSYVHKNARQPEGYLYQMELSTQEGYDAYIKRRTEEPLLFLQD